MKRAAASRWTDGNHFELLENGEDFFPRVNAAIAREKDRFTEELAAENQVKPTEGWMIWHEGLIGNFISNNEGITSIVLVEQKLSAGDEHGKTFAKGLNFNGAGDLFDLPQVLPRPTWSIGWAMG